MSLKNAKYMALAFILASATASCNAQSALNSSATNNTVEHIPPKPDPKIHDDPHSVAETYYAYTGESITYTTKQSDTHVREVSTFKNGVRDGAHMRYFRNGNIEFIKHYKAGKLDGDQAFFYENGQIQLQSIYANGDRHGSLTYFTPLGCKAVTAGHSEGIAHGFWLFLVDLSSIDEHDKPDIIKQMQKNLNPEANTWIKINDGIEIERTPYPVNPFAPTCP